MSEPAQKCENYAIFKQNYTPELLIALKMVYYCFFCLRGNLDFPDFLQKMFFNINSISIRFSPLFTHPDRRTDGPSKFSRLAFPGKFPGIGRTKKIVKSSIAKAFHMFSF